MSEIVMLFNKWPVTAFVEAVVVGLMLITVVGIIYIVDKTIENGREKRGKNGSNKL